MGTSSKTAENELLEFDAIQDYSTDCFLVKSRALNVSENISNTNELYSIASDRLIETFLHNRSNSDKRYQNTIWEDGIHPKIAAELHQNIFKYFKDEVFTDLQVMFDQAVEDTQKIKSKKTYPVYGVSVFEFLEK
ncbi:hypothetical protein MNBD_GAMMA02-1056 [hydrothermal vent metagenome]|uniref:Uncharacterized protein n=1 Tax=hydrothermal vent metagenome TaxID=652676 RepID=A0A3B0WAC1_9ZZZZ